MFSKAKSTQLDAINLTYTEEELARQKELLQTLLDAVSNFLDEEEHLGFLKQKYVDLLILVENILQDLLSSTPNMLDISFQRPMTHLAYLVKDDDINNDTHLHHRHKQPEI